MDNNDIKAKRTIIDDEKKEEITLPIKSSLTVTKC